jgi:hypothetical protein
MARLFISYSRQNIEMARRIAEDCKEREIDFWIDWEGIEPSLDWWKEIEKGIEQADNFVFLISPDSIASPVCRREIEHGLRNGKRLIPVIVQKVRPQDAPPEIASLNWIFLDEPEKFADGMERLARAIDTDFAWVEFHRRLQVKALEWERGKKDGSFLLRGRDLQDAEAQLATHASTEPLPTGLQREYALESRQASDRQRRRNTAIAFTAIVLLALLAVVAVLQANRATRNESIALTKEAEAERQSEIALSRQLSAKSKVELLVNDDRRLSLLYALEALNTAEAAGDFQNIDAAQALRDALERTGGEVMVSPDTSVLVQWAALSPSADWLAVDYRDERIDLWDLQASRKYLLRKEKPGSDDVLYFSPGGKHLVLLTNPLQVWDVADPSKTKHSLQLEQGPPGTMRFSPDGTAPGC